MLIFCSGTSNSLNLVNVASKSSRLVTVVKSTLRTLSISVSIRFLENGTSKLKLLREIPLLLNKLLRRALLPL